MFQCVIWTLIPVWQQNWCATYTAGFWYKFWRPKEIKSKNKKVYSNLEWLGSALSLFFSNAEVLNLKLFGPLTPIMVGSFIWLIILDISECPKNVWISHWWYHLKSQENSMEQSKEINQNCKEPKMFDICFCIIFSCYDQSLFMEGTLDTRFCLHPVLRFS